MMTWVSISGTALSIFLVMAFFMCEQVKSVAIAPQSNRGRILLGYGIHTKSIDPNGNYDGSSSGIDDKLAERLYSNLPGIETISYISSWADVAEAGIRGKSTRSARTRRVDGNYWKIYDFRFLHGKPFDLAESKAGADQIVITAGTARTIFGKENVVGATLEVDHVPYYVKGVVEDSNPIMEATNANIFLPFTPSAEASQQWYGETNAVLLMKPDADVAAIKAEVQTRYKRLDSELEAEGLHSVYHLQPYTAEEQAAGIPGSNNDPDIAAHHRTRWIIYTLLVLLPAINLSSMTRSRLRHRVSEIGVRRAFGARRSEIVRQLFSENLIITIIGGAAGLIFSMICVMLISHLFFAMGEVGAGTSLDIVQARPSFAMLFRWQTFAVALGICFVLNILCASLPAWRASRMEPAQAISRAR